MRKHAYLIMAHNQWDLLEKLLYLIDDERNDIYLHIDKKVHSFPKDRLQLAVCKSNLYFTKRFNITWAGTKALNCELELLKMASDQYDYSMYHLLSGVDLPIKNQDEIHKFFDDHMNYEFIDIDWDEISRGVCFDRIKYYHFFINFIGRNREGIFSKLNRVFLRIQKLIKINRMSDTEIYNGGQWFSITNKLALSLVNDRKKLLNRYKFTISPDEEFIQNYVMNSSFKENVYNSSMRCIFWKENACSPECITMEKLMQLKQSDMFFARKFNTEVDTEVIQEIMKFVKRDISR